MATATKDFKFLSKEEVSPEQLATVRLMNNDTVPACNDLTMEMLQEIVAEAAIFCVAVPADTDDAAEVAGFMIAMARGAKYESPNYVFFCKAFPEESGVNFCYTDRVVVGPNFFRRGLGTALYNAVAEQFRSKNSLKPDDALKLCCEVNLRPPNPESIAFHTKVGFSSIGEQEVEDGAKTVTMLAMDA